MDVHAIKHKNRTTKEVETIFVLHFNHRYAFDQFIDYLYKSGFSDVAAFAQHHWNEDGKYSDAGGTCILHENYMAMVFVYLLGEEMERKKK